MFFDEDAEEHGWISYDWYNGATGNTDADELAEFGGRACYQAWERKNPKTATNEGYLANIIDQGHESVLAHASFSFYIEGVSRSLTHELIRHRFLAFSELSQRYVAMEDSYTVIPPLFRGDELAREYIQRAEDEAKNVYDLLVDLAEKRLEDQGVTGFAKRKQARQAARAVLPGGTETKILVSGNVRAWRDFIKQRWSVHADDEIRELAGEILSILQNYAPNSVQDFPVDPFGTETFSEKVGMESFQAFVDQNV